MHIITPKELEEILLHFSQSMTEIDSEEDLLWDLVGNCISKLNFEDAVVYLLDESGQYLEQKAALGPKSSGNREIIQAIRVPVGKGVTGKVVNTGLPLLIQDTRQFSDYIPDDQYRLSEVAVPILLEGKVIGVIDSENSQAGYFTEQHVRILNAVASIYSGQIARIRAEKNLQEKQEKLLELQKRNYQFQLEALSAQLSPHFVFNSLNSIQNQIFRDDKESSLRFLSIFAKLLRYFLSQLHLEKAALKEEVQMLNWYMQLQKLRYGDSLHFEIKAEERLSIDRVKIPSMVIQNLLENLLEEQIQSANGAISLLVTFEKTQNAVAMQAWINQSDKKGNVEKRKTGNQPTRTWEDFVLLMNEIKPFHIQYETGEKPCPQSQKPCKYVTLILPILDE